MEQQLLSANICWASTENRVGERMASDQDSFIEKEGPEE